MLVNLIVLWRDYKKILMVFHGRIAFGSFFTTKNCFYLIAILSQVPNVIWEDVGGLEDVKKAILDTVQVCLACI